MGKDKVKPITIIKALTFISLLSLLTSSLVAQISVNAQTSDSDWYQNGARAVEDASRRSYNNSPGAAKNIILFLGDGMGPSTVTAARIFAGQQQGLSGEEYSLSFESFPWTGLVKTYNTDAQVPDSAGTMTAIMTGIKTRSGVIGIDGRPLRGSCESYMNTQGARLISALELAEVSGKATGIVSTAKITHATPAATYANSPDRNWESISNMPDEAKTMGCTDIASQLVDFESRLESKLNRGNDHPNIDGIDVAFGGGRNAFYSEDPASIAGFAETVGQGNRDDGRNLIDTWVNQDGRYIMDREGFNNIDSSDSRNVLGLFENSHMRYEANRNEDVGGEPSLTEMTMKAIELLENDDDGFFLMVEAGRIDHAHHANNAFNALNEAAELSRAVQAAVNAVDTNETLIIVTADHSHVMTMAGYPTRGNPILGKVIGNDSNGRPQTELTRDRDGLPYTTLSYTNGSGFDDNGNNTNADSRSAPPAAGRHDLTIINTEAPGYHQETLVGTFGETHGGEDVGVYAIGPGAHLVSGAIEQNVIFHVMNYAADLEKKAADALE
jgi:alkaline phosphatase